jgi:hypothetical protein
MANKGTNKNKNADESQSASQNAVETQTNNQEVINPVKKVDDRLVFSLDVFNELSEEDYPSPVSKNNEDLANANIVSNSIFDEIEKEEKKNNPSLLIEKKKASDKEAEGEFEYLNDEKDRILIEDIEKELQEKKSVEEKQNNTEDVVVATESNSSNEDKSDLSEKDKGNEATELVVEMDNKQYSADEKSSEELSNIPTSNEKHGESALVSIDTNKNSKHKFRVNTDAEKPSDVISVLSWFFLVFLTFIPGLNLMILVVLGFSKDVDEQVSSWAKASLIIWSIITILILYWYRHFIDLFLL